MPASPDLINPRFIKNPISPTSPPQTHTNHMSTLHETCSTLITQMDRPEKLYLGDCTNLAFCHGTCPSYPKHITSLCSSAAMARGKGRLCGPYRRPRRSVSAGTIHSVAKRSLWQSMSVAFPELSWIVDDSLPSFLLRSRRALGYCLSLLFSSISRI